MKEVLKKLEGKRVSILVGIPSYNNAETISHVAKTASEGIVKYFNGDGLIVNSDGDSSDGTREVFMSTETDVEKYSFVYEGIPGKGSAIKAIFEVAKIVDADAVVLLDADLRSVQPWWVERLAKPILDGKASYVAPHYLRHKYDGTITNNICYPLTSALYGKKIRQPIGGDFGISGELVSTYLSKPESVWKSDVARFGIDIWMTTIAVNESKNGVVQAALGAKIHDVKDPGKHLGPMFVQVVSTLFSLMSEYQDRWMRVKEMLEIEVYGEQPSQNVEPIVVDLENLKKKAMEGVRNYREFLRSYIDEEILNDALDDGMVNTDEWVKLVYDSAVAFRKYGKNVVEAMIPLYFSRVAGFVEETKDMDSEEAENVIEKQLERFFEMKGYLAKKWIE
ncbi:MAG: glycosyltransferase [Thermotogaceae bacterium]|nr:glycosyltransferase [Thermotogaceae bacterium]